jgi:hypothetical protein
MNRIILIGNGFDLAHELKTSYRDFISFFWEKQIGEIENRVARGFVFSNDFMEIEVNYPVQFNSTEKYNDNYDKFINWINDCKSWGSRNGSSNSVKVRFKNDFLMDVTQKGSLQTWVDIEEEYYLHLLECLKDTKGKQIKKLNEEFAIIKNLLEKYLVQINQKESNAKEDIRNAIYSCLQLNDFSEKGKNAIIEEEYNTFLEIEKQVFAGKEPRYYQPLTKVEDWIDAIRTGRISKDNFRQYFISQSKLYSDLQPQYFLLLNFNYTSTDRIYEQYHERLNTVHIHGKLNSTINPIIFGYGDEMDKSYKEIENMNNNNFLENVKSILYSDTDNYKKMNDFINSDNYQVFAMGHSCGISDRTLLNRLFEHDNCVSIKVFYHKQEDGTDNFSDIVKNISRNFTNKINMRDKVVNKQYCRPLTQYK